MSTKVTAPALHHKVAGNGDSDRQFWRKQIKVTDCLRPSSAAKTTVRIQHVSEQDLKIKRKGVLLYKPQAFLLFVCTPGQVNYWQKERCS